MFGFDESLPSFDEVPEEFRALYTKGEDGSAKLQDTFSGVANAVRQLNGTLAKARSDADASRKKIVDLSPLAEYGNDPKSIAESIQDRLSSYSAKDSEFKSNLDKIKADLSKSHTQELSAREERINNLTGQLHKLMVDNVLQESLRHEKASPLLAPIIKQHVRVTEENGSSSVLLVDNDNEVRYSGATQAPMSIPEYIKELRSNKEYAPFFESQAPAGGGKSPSTPRYAPKPQGEMSSIDKISEGLRQRGVT